MNKDEDDLESIESINEFFRKGSESNFLNLNLIMLMMKLL